MYEKHPAFLVSHRTPASVPVIHLHPGVNKCSDVELVACWRLSMMTALDSAPHNSLLFAQLLSDQAVLYRILYNSTLSWDFGAWAPAASSTNNITCPPDASSCCVHSIFLREQQAKTLQCCNNEYRCISRQLHPLYNRLDLNLITITSYVNLKNRWKPLFTCTSYGVLPYSPI